MCTGGVHVTLNGLGEGEEKCNVFYFALFLEHLALAAYFH